MGLLKGLILAAVDTVVLPVMVVKDVVTLGGVGSDQPPATLTQLRKIRADIANTEE